MGSVEYDTRVYHAELGRSRSMWDDEDFLRDMRDDEESEPYRFDKERCTEPMVRMVHEAAMCVAAMNAIRWGRQTHSVIPEAV